MRLGARSLLVLSVAVPLFGCREAAGPGDYRHFRSSLGFVHKMTVKRETPPPGFVGFPKSTQWHCTDYVASELRGGVVTLAINDDVVIEHVDDSAAIYESPKGPNHALYIPIVGPHGERLTRTVRVEGTERAPKLTPFGDPIPRVTAFCPFGKGKFWPAVAAADDLFVPLGQDHRPITLPPGVAGMKVFEDEVWLVKWKGAKGEGWSLSAQADLSDSKDVEPRWSSVRARSREERLLVGERRSGGCEVVRIAPEGAPSLPKEFTAPSCEEALTAYWREAQPVLAAAAAAAASKSAATKRYEEEQAREAAKAEGDAKERLRIAAGEAERKKTEDPILMAAAALLAKTDSAGACREMSKLAPERHAQIVLESQHFTYLDLTGIECARRRSPLMFSTMQRLDEAARRNYDAITMAVEAQKANQPGVRERIGGGIGAGSIGDVDKKPGNAEILKGMKDYNYGSGKASACPYQDKSLCNK